MLVIMTGFGSRVQLKTSYFFFSLSLSSERSMVDKHRTVLVFFIGGCTFAEIASLRFLSQREDGEIVRNDIHVWRYFCIFTIFVLTEALLFIGQPLGTPV